MVEWLDWKSSIEHWRKTPTRRRSGNGRRVGFPHECNKDGAPQSKRHHQPKKRRESLLRGRVFIRDFSRVSRERGDILGVSINRVKHFFSPLRKSAVFGRRSRRRTARGRETAKKIRHERRNSQKTSRRERASARSRVLGPVGRCGART